MKLRQSMAMLFLAGSICIATVHAQAQTASADTTAGAAVFKSANCIGCHKWSGVGGGGYGGSAANLRKTLLSEQLIAETVRCGHPGGGMPYFAEDAYANGSCYGIKASGTKATSLPPAAEHMLQPRDIAAVAAYVAADLKGKGDPTYEQCVAFFGHETHICNDYPKTAGTTGAPAASAGHHLEIDEAPDQNEVHH